MHIVSYCAHYWSAAAVTSSLAAYLHGHQLGNAAVSSASHIDGFEKIDQVCAIDSGNLAEYWT